MERTASTTPIQAARPADHAWIFRLGTLRARFAMFITLAAAIVGAILWMASKVLTIRSDSGTSVGLSVRTDAHLATWIQRLEPYVPNLHRDGSKDRFSLSIFLVPLDGSEPRLLPVHSGLSPNEFVLARILGSDGRRLWVEAKGVSTIDLETFAVREATGPAPANLRGEPSSRMPPTPEDLLAAGYLLSADTWLGLLSAQEVVRNYKPNQWVLRVLQAENGKEPRRFQRAVVTPDRSGKYHSIVSMAALGEETYLNAGFLRPSTTAEPLRLHDPEGTLIAFTLGSPHFGTLAIARVDEAGHVLWQTDTGIERFSMTQILPGTDSTGFVGTGPRQPDKVPEPRLAILDHATGRLVTHSLWR